MHKPAAKNRLKYIQCTFVVSDISHVSFYMQWHCKTKPINQKEVCSSHISGICTNSQPLYGLTSLHYVSCLYAPKVSAEMFSGERSDPLLCMFAQVFMRVCSHIHTACQRGFEPLKTLLWLCPWYAPNVKLFSFT